MAGKSSSQHQKGTKAILFRAPLVWQADAAETKRSAVPIAVGATIDRQSALDAFAPTRELELDRRQNGTVSVLGVDYDSLSLVEVPHSSAGCPALSHSTNPGDVMRKLSTYSGFDFNSSVE